MHRRSLVALAAKRKRGEEVAGDVHREAAAVLGAGLDQDTLWRVNPEEFNRRFRHQLVQTLVRLGLRGTGRARAPS